MSLPRCVGACVLMLCLGFASVASGQDKQRPERFVGRAADVRLYEIVIERSSTSAECGSLVRILETQGEHGVLLTLAAIKVQAGYARKLGAGSTPSAGDVEMPIDFKCVFESETNNGRRILMVGSSSSEARIEKESISAVELRLGPTGNGKGWLWLMTDRDVLVGRAERRLEVEHNSRWAIALTVSKR
jgi:hypothetical protein